LVIEEEVPLSEAPLRADLVMIRTRTDNVLPYPFDLLGQQTLTEFKGPHDTATEKELETLEIYGLLYRHRHRLPARADLTLWLIASRISGGVSNPAGAFVHELRDIGPGVRGGVLDGFPTYLIELELLPITAATLPLMMVYKGKREVEVADFLIEHRHEFPDYMTPLVALHTEAFVEVLNMRQVDATTTDIDWQAIAARFGKERLVEIYAPIMRAYLKAHGSDLLTEDVIMQTLSEEHIVKMIAQRIGRERLEQLIHDLPEESLKPRRTRRKKK